VNQFDWGKALSSAPHRHTLDYTRGLIALRRATDAFSYADHEDIERLTARLFTPDTPVEDLLLTFTVQSLQNGDVYLVAVNADSAARQVSLSELAILLNQVEVLVDGYTAGTAVIENPVDVELLPAEDGEHLGALDLKPLTAVVIRVKEE
jgi:pullulanase/glycogen debranching enzyme